ncbi:MAG: hypothetical protein GYB42_11780, partial [Alphaproteobacteria bacterium]|nr:hypothetical protein [Alphaproteobacteria bacterium]
SPSSTSLATTASTEIVANPDFAFEAAFALPDDVVAQFHYPISTESTEAQHWFDTGLTHMANFNHDEAIAAFRQAQAADADCAMCYWGEALSFGSNINAPYDANRGAAGRLAANAALARLEGASEIETALIQAVDARYTVSAEGTVAEDAEGFADAMDSAALQFPTDTFILSLAAEANMDTQPWNYWQPGSRLPLGRTERTLALLEDALAINPDHAPSIHLYIHVTESSIDPYRAEAYADTLWQQSLGVGHLVHMPSHIYLRLGRWKKAHAANIAAIAADEAYIAGSDNAGFYGAVYYPHNVHFVVASSQFAGDAATAQAMSAKLGAIVALNPDMSEPYSEHVAASQIFTDLLYGTDEAVLARPEPAAAHVYMRMAWHYARGTVFARRGELDAAHAELAALGSLTEAPAYDAYAPEMGIPLPTILKVANLTLKARLMAADGDLTGAIATMEEAVESESAIPYFEPTWWYYPTRQTLGLYLLQDGQLDRAEREFYRTLIKAPNNAYALYGLAETFRAKGDAASETYARELFSRAWMGEDGTLPDLNQL